METDKNQDFGVYTWLDAEKSEREAIGLSGKERADALCLSGGGIRSAAFCLGVLQALDARHVLTEFHYLSTVSGGGFIASWLTRWTAERAKVATMAKPPQDATLPPLDQIRRYSNFLTPQPGPFSLDSWQAILLWIRNTVINWLAFGPVLAVTVCIPIIYLSLMSALVGADQSQNIRFGLCLVALSTLCWSVYKACIDLPSHKHPDGDPAAFDPKAYGPEGAAITRRAIIFVVFWAAVAPLAQAPAMKLVRPKEPTDSICALRSRAAPEAPKATIQLSWASSNPKAASCPVRPEAPSGKVLMADVQGLDLSVAGLCPGQTPIAAASPGAGLPACEPWAKDINAFVLTYLLIPLGSLLACLLAYGLAWRRVVNGPDYLSADNRMLQRISFSRNFLSWALSSTISAGLLLLGIWVAETSDVIWCAIFGPLWVVGSDVLRTTVYLAVRHEGLRSDLDREWLARLSADKLRIVLTATCVAAASLLIPHGLFGDSTTLNIIISGLGFTTGTLVAKIASAAAIAFQPNAFPTGKKPFWLKADFLIAAVALLFMIFLAAVAGRAIFALDLRLDHLANVYFCINLATWWGFLAIASLTLAVCLMLVFSFSRSVKINRFSLHAVYRNRIIRAFLGTARPWRLRRPDRFTGFDPVDNIRVTDCASSVRPARLFPVINVTLNMTSSRDLISADRKAEAFTVTPLHCGSGALSPPFNGADRPFKRSGAYVPTCFYAGGDERDTGPGDKMLGISLGTAIAISGAAVSPNMGYHSSPLAAFVMTLFNLRLGAWLPNPAMHAPDRKKMKRSSPRRSLLAAFGELFGQTDDLGSSVYLSDGGHFDNLGLYEMLRRRCGRIVVIDAGADADFKCADFGRVLSYAKVDLGVSIDFAQPLKIPDKTAWQRVRVGTIHYSNPSETGELLYIKPCLSGDEPAQIAAFAAAHSDFPHTSTADQFFTGSVFEGYRALGEFQALRAFNAKPMWVIGSCRLTGLDAIFRRAAALKAKP